MTTLKALFGRRDFFSEQKIASYINKSKNFDSDSENPKNAKTFLFFETSKQHTWLVATEYRLYCILDDIRKPNPHINWSMSRQAIFNEKEEINIPIGVRSYYIEGTGLVDFGLKHKNWLYSESLFREQKVDDAVRNFIENNMRRSS